MWKHLRYLNKSSIWRWENRWLAAAFSILPGLYAFLDIAVGSCMQLLRQVHTVELSYQSLAALEVGHRLCSRLGRRTDTSRASTGSSASLCGGGSRSRSRRLLGGRSRRLLGVGSRRLLGFLLLLLSRLVG